MILRHALRYPESMVRLRSICRVYPAELRPKNGPKTARLPPEQYTYKTMFRPKSGVP